MKLIHVTSWFAVACVVIYTGHSSGSETVSIGAMMSLNSITGKVLQIAVKAAVEDINSDPNVLDGRTLSLQIHDSNYSGFLSVMEALQFMETDAVAIIGPQSSDTARFLANLANELHVPLLSVTALDPTLSPIQYPYFFQTAPNDLFQMAAISEVVSYFRWTQVIAIYTDDYQSRNGITALADKLRDRRCKIAYKVVLPPDIRELESLVLQELSKVKTMEARVLVVHTLATQGPVLLTAANKLGMMGDGYVWIATSWLSSVLDSQQHPEIFKIAQGLVTVRIHTPDSHRKRAFVNRWKQLSQGSTGLTVHGLYAYDTVWLVANAIRKFLREGNRVSFTGDPVLAAIEGGSMNLSALSIFDKGKQFLKSILETNMSGVTGTIRFNSERLLVNPSFDVINIVGNQLRLIGYWAEYSGLSVVAPEILRNRPQNRSSVSQMLYSVVWPGGHKAQPRGWVFPQDGRKLRIGVPRRTSFRDFIFQDDQTHEVHGYCIDVFLAALKLLPYAVPYQFILYGDGHQNPSYSELVRKISDGEFDAAVGDIAIVTNRTKIADFTQPYTDSGLVVVVPVKKMTSSAWAFLRPFTGFMWAVTTAFLFMVGAVIWLLEHGINDEFRGRPRVQILTVLWFSFSTLFFAHRENTVSTPGRLVLVIWLFVVLIIQQSYTASLTSYLTVQQLSSQITGIESLIASNDPIGFQVGSYAENYLNEELNIRKSRLIALKSPEEYANALEKGRVVAVVDERPYVDLFLSSYCHFSIAGGEFTKSGWGFAFKRDSPLALDMSTALLELSESGSLRNITDTWLRNRTACGPQIAVYNSDRLQPDNFIGLFVICGVACIIALIIYFFPRVYQLYRKPPGNLDSQSSGSSPSSHVGTVSAFADRRDDLPRRKVKRKRSFISCNGT